MPGVLHGSRTVHMRACAGTGSGPAAGGGHGVTVIARWPGLNKGKKMTAGPRSSLRKVVRVTIKCVRDSNETSSSQSTFSNTSKFFTMIYFSLQHMSHVP